MLFEKVRGCDQQLNPRDKHHAKDVSKLRERIVAAWDELDQRIINTAVRQWRTRLCACVKALAGHFKLHKLRLVVLESH